MIKIETTNKISKSELSRIRKKRDEADGAAFSSSIEKEDEQVGQAIGVSGAHPTQLLLNLQEMGEKEVARYHGDKILEFLESYKMALTTQTNDADVLKELDRYLSSHALEVKDPRIQQVLAEIELRAKLELAKRGLI